MFMSDYATEVCKCPLKAHPKTGTGKVEPLKGYDGTVYSRRITHGHRLVYKIYDDVVEVLILSAFGHYE